MAFMGFCLVFFGELCDFVCEVFEFGVDFCFVVGFAYAVDDLAYVGC